MGNACVKRDREVKPQIEEKKRPFHEELAELSRTTLLVHRPFLGLRELDYSRKFAFHVFGNEDVESKSMLFEMPAIILKFKEELEPVDKEAIRQEMGCLLKIKNQCQSITQHLMSEDISEERKKVMIQKFRKFISQTTMTSPVKTHTVQTPDLQNDLEQFDISSPERARKTSQVLKYIDFETRRANPTSIFFFIADIIHKTIDCIDSFNPRKVLQVFQTLICDIAILEQFKKIPYEDKIDLQFALYEQRALELEEFQSFPYQAILDYKFIATNLISHECIMSQQQQEMLEEVINFVGDIIEKGNYHYIYAYSQLGHNLEPERPYSQYQLRKEMFYILKTGQFKLLPFYKRNVSVMTRGKYRMILKDDLNKGQMIYAILHQLSTLRSNFFSSELYEQEISYSTNWDWLETTFFISREVGAKLVKNSNFMRQFQDLENWKGTDFVNVVYKSAIKELSKKMKRASTLIGGSSIIGNPAVARNGEEVGDPAANDGLGYSMSLSTEAFIKQRESTRQAFYGGEE